MLELRRAYEQAGGYACISRLYWSMHYKGYNAILFFNFAGWPKWLHARQVCYTGVELGLFMVLTAVCFDTEVWLLNTGVPEESGVSISQFVFISDRRNP